MLNEVNMANNYSMALGVEYMKNFGPDYNWEKYTESYQRDQIAGRTVVKVSFMIVYVSLLIMLRLF